MLVRSFGARLALGREVTCDDETVRATGDPLLVLSALLSFATPWASKRGAVQPRHGCLITSPNVETCVRKLVAYRAPDCLGRLHCSFRHSPRSLFVLGVVATR